MERQIAYDKLAREDRFVRMRAREVAQLKVDQGLRPLGAVVTPETLHGMATYPASIAVLILAMALISFAGAGYLRVVHRWDNVDAYLAAAPGGMSQVLALGAELGADLRAIAIVQSIRVVEGPVQRRLRLRQPSIT